MTATAHTTGNYTAEEYVRALLAANGEQGEKDMFYRPFRLGVMAGAEAGDNISPEFQQELMRRSLEKFQTPPPFLSRDRFALTVRVWGGKIVGQLRAILRDDGVDDGVRGAVAQALGAMNAVEAVPEMRQILRDEGDDWVRRTVRRALEQIAIKHKIAMPW